MVTQVLRNCPGQGLTPSNVPVYSGHAAGVRSAASNSLRGGATDCPSAATSPRIRGIVQRTNRTAGARIGRIAADAESLLDGLARARPRYLLHGSIALVGVVTIAA